VSNKAKLMFDGRAAVVSLWTALDSLEVTRNISVDLRRVLNLTRSGVKMLERTLAFRSVRPGAFRQVPLNRTDNGHRNSLQLAGLPPMRRAVEEESG
jgi:hypothetical protein